MLPSRSVLGAPLLRRPIGHGETIDKRAWSVQALGRYGLLPWSTIGVIWYILSLLSCHQVAWPKLTCVYIISLLYCHQVSRLEQSIVYISLVCCFVTRWRGWSRAVCICNEFTILSPGVASVTQHCVYIISSLSCHQVGWLDQSIVYISLVHLFFPRCRVWSRALCIYH